MSDAAGAQAISAVSRGEVREILHARTFMVLSRDGERIYFVTLGNLPETLTPLDWCTCEAGRNGHRCWHVRAAHLMARRAA